MVQYHEKITAEMTTFTPHHLKHLPLEIGLKYLRRLCMIIVCMTLVN